MNKLHVLATALLLTAGMAACAPVAPVNSPSEDSTSDSSISDPSTSDPSTSKEPSVSDPSVEPSVDPSVEPSVTPVEFDIAGFNSLIKDLATNMNFTIVDDYYNLDIMWNHNIFVDEYMSLEYNEPGSLELPLFGGGTEVREFSFSGEDVVLGEINADVSTFDQLNAATKMPTLTSDDVVEVLSETEAVLSNEFATLFTELANYDTGDVLPTSTAVVELTETGLIFTVNESIGSDLVISNVGTTVVPGAEWLNSYVPLETTSLPTGAMDDMSGENITFTGNLSVELTVEGSSPEITQDVDIINRFTSTKTQTIMNEGGVVVSNTIIIDNGEDGILVPTLSKDNVVVNTPYTNSFADFKNNAADLQDLIVSTDAGATFAVSSAAADLVISNLSGFELSDGVLVPTIVDDKVTELTYTINASGYVGDAAATQVTVLTLVASEKGTTEVEDIKPFEATEHTAKLQTAIDTLSAGNYTATVVDPDSPLFKSVLKVDGDKSLVEATDYEGATSYHGAIDVDDTTMRLFDVDGEGAKTASEADVEGQVLGEFVGSGIVSANVFKSDDGVNFSVQAGMGVDVLYELLPSTTTRDAIELGDEVITLGTDGNIESISFTYNILDVYFGSETVTFSDYGTTVVDVVLADVAEFVAPPAATTWAELDAELAAELEATLGENYVEIPFVDGEWGFISSTNNLYSFDVTPETYKAALIAAGYTTTDEETYVNDYYSILVADFYGCVDLYITVL